MQEQLKEHIDAQLKAEQTENPNLSYEEFMNTNSRRILNFEPDKHFLAADGEEVIACEGKYRVDLSAIESILDWFAGNKNYILTNVKFKGKKFQSADISYLTRGNKKAESDAVRIICFFISDGEEQIETNGSIGIDNDKMTIFSMSHRAYSSITRDLTDNFGKHLTFENESIKPAAETVMEAKEDEEDDTEKPLSKKEKALSKEFLINYYKGWCRQKIPALGNKTPKEMVKTKEGREKLKSLLIDFENAEEHKRRDEGIDIPVVKTVRDELKFYD